MTNRPRPRQATAALVAAAALGGCMDLEVTNPNQPDLLRALPSADVVEMHVAGAFHDWFVVQTDYNHLPPMLSAVAFQHGTWNVCAAPYAEIPRRPLENALGRQCIETYRTWHRLYRALTRVADGLAVLETHPAVRTDLGDDAHARLLAFARFVQGVAHGSLALLFDRAAIVDETTDRTPSALRDYREVAVAALGYLDEAARLADGAGWPAIPATWTSVEIGPDELVRLARSYAAQLRANLARTPADREQVDWGAVLDDAAAGIEADWRLGGSLEWRARALWILYQENQPTYLSYFILGMADQSGAYQRWLARYYSDRHPAPADEDPILLVTADTRFPRGATMAEQRDEPGSRFFIPDRINWGQPARGTWRWSFYRYSPADDYGQAEEARWPLITVAEMRLLRAEALYRLGDRAGAATLVNESRTRHGLGPTDQAGANDDCVPRLPDGVCGGLMEMLKWEKRLETKWTGPFLASWYFDGRGWGDLHAGTFLQAPVPCSELTILQEGCYTFGGAGPHGSPGSSYAWPFEVPGAN